MVRPPLTSRFASLTFFLDVSQRLSLLRRVRSSDGRCQRYPTFCSRWPGKRPSTPRRECYPAKNRRNSLPKLCVFDWYFVFFFSGKETIFQPWHVDSYSGKLFQYVLSLFLRVAVISAQTHKRQRRERQSVTAKREKSQTPKFLTATLTLPNLT